MPANFQWFQNHPIVTGLVLIGGIGGGISALNGGIVAVQSLFEGKPIVLNGRICPALYASDCIQSNKEFHDQLNGIHGKIVQVDLKIEQAWHDKRDDTCGDDWIDTKITYANAAQGDWNVMEIPTEDNDCSFVQLIAFDSTTLKDGEVSSGGGGTEYVIKGAFLVGLAGSLPPGMPTVAEKGFLTFKPR